MSLVSSTLRRRFGGLAAAVLLSALPAAAMADVNVGFIVPATGSTAALGIPGKNALFFFPPTIGGEKINVHFADDASDPAQATTLARRLVTEDKVDVLVGSTMTGCAIAISGVAQENEVPQLAMSPIDLPAGHDTWTFRLPQSVKLMAEGVVAHMQAAGIKTVGYIGFSDAWGDFWARDFKQLGEAAGIKLVAEERFARADTSVTGQILKLIAAHPDAVLVGASGTAAALPQITLRERGYKGPIYQTHGAVSQDFIRIGGAAVEGAIVPAGPAMVPEQLPDSALSKAPGLDFVTRYEERYGANSRNQFAAHAYDAVQVLKRVIPVALKTAKPGTKEFHEALKAALESEKNIAASQGVYNYSRLDHFGLDGRGRVMLTVQNGKWVLLP